MHHIADRLFVGMLGAETRHVWISDDEAAR
jgi:hypothetical protein